jgi:hypothetical protein
MSYQVITLSLRLRYDVETHAPGNHKRSHSAGTEESFWNFHSTVLFAIVKMTKDRSASSLSSIESRDIVNLRSLWNRHMA